MTLAILSALSEEQHGLVDAMDGMQCLQHAGRSFWQGQLGEHAVVCALSGIGKVAAATTTAALIERFGVQAIVFTGVAGGLGEGVNVGDVVVATDFLQHDLDASPLFARYEVPFYGKARFEGDAALTALLVTAATGALADAVENPVYPAARVHRGLIASGDRFVCGASESLALRAALTGAGHEVLAVEMEGAAVAQVCLDYGVPFAAVRTISDHADDLAHLDFPGFMDQVAGAYARGIIERLLRLL